MNETDQDSLPRPAAVPAAGSAKRRQYLLMGGVVALLGIVGLASLWLEEAPMERPPKVAEKSVVEVPGRTLSDREVWIAKSERRLADAEQRNAEIEQRLKELETRRVEEAERLNNKEVLKPPAITLPPAASPPPLPVIPSATALGGAMQPIPPPLNQNPTSGGKLPPGEVVNRGIKRITLATPVPASSAGGDGAAAQPPAAQKQVGRWIPAGSFTQAVLLGGLDAPTGGQAQSNPHPVLARLKDNSILPNRFRTRTRECHVVGAGYGDISSERAYIRIETLSCVLKTGRILELPVQGYIAGEDGKTGMRGRLVSKEGQILARALLAGLGSGIGQGLAQSSTTLSTSALGSTQSIDPGKVLENGAYTGVGKALDRLAQYYITLAEKIFPVIEVAAGRTVDVVLTKGVPLDEDINAAWGDLEDEFDSEERM